MRTVILGAGQVGFRIAERLGREGQNVVIIERDSLARARAHE